MRPDEVHEEGVEGADFEPIAESPGKVLADPVGDLPYGGAREGQEDDPLLGLQAFQCPGGFEQRDGGLAAARSALDQQVTVRIQDVTPGVVDVHHGVPGSCPRASSAGACRAGASLRRRGLPGQVGVDVEQQPGQGTRELPGAAFGDEQRRE